MKRVAADGNRRSYPELEMIIRVSPEAQWRFLQFLLEGCVFLGVPEFSLIIKPGEKINLKFPFDIMDQD